MTTRTWVNNGGLALSAANLNSLEADVTAALGVPDAALAARVVAGTTKTALDAAYVNEADFTSWKAAEAVAKKVFYVKDTAYAGGAKGDTSDAGGGTDDTAAIQACWDAANAVSGGIVFYSPGQYKMDGKAILRSNMKHVGYGAKIRKFSSNTTYTAFEAQSNGAQGYGSSVQNVTFEGLTFQGVFGSGATGIAVTLHHAQNITFRKCTWIEAVISGHGIDLLGCDGVLVDDCTFKGFKVTTNREYVEAIQCDYSMVEGGGSDVTTSFDGLPTINVTVQNSRFLPLTVGGTLYPAPNPIGSHSRVAGRWIENIKFLNNYMEGGAATDDTFTITDGFAQLTRGWIHFFCARNIQVVGNHFKNTRTYTDAAQTNPDNFYSFGKVVAARIFGAYPISTGTALADVQVSPAASSQAMTPMPMSNFLFQGNIIEGFSSAGNESIVDVRGTNTTTTKATGLKFIENTIKDCHPTPGVPGDTGSDLFYVQDAVGVTVRDNNVRYARGLIYAFRTDKIKVLGGTLRDIGMWQGRFSTCTSITITDVDVENFGAGWYFYNACVGLHMSGGSIIQNYTAAQITGLGNNSPISLSGTSQFYIHHVRVPYNSVPGYLQVVNSFSSPTNGRVENNITIGWGAQTQVSTSTGVLKGTGTGVVSQNNML